MTTDKEPATRRVYGRGFRDGYEKALSDMNKAKIAELERDQTVTARKVLNVVPIGEPWLPPLITSELRKQGVMMEHHIMMGCLNTLKQAGLVKESVDGFRRVVGSTATVAPAVTPTVANPVTRMPEKVIPPPTPIDRLADLAAATRALAKEANELANRIEEAALEVDEAVQALGQDSAKLRQLQELLRGAA